MGEHSPDKLFYPDWLDDIRLPPQTKVVLCHIYRVAGWDGYCDETIEEIARYCMVSKNTAMRAIHALIKLGLIRRVRCCHKPTKLYPLLAHGHKALDWEQRKAIMSGKHPKSNRNQDTLAKSNRTSNHQPNRLSDPAPNLTSNDANIISCTKSPTTQSPSVQEIKKVPWFTSKDLGPEATELHRAYDQELLRRYLKKERGRIYPQSRGEYIVGCSTFYKDHTQPVRKTA